jgi:hypothetical protein
MLPEIMVKSTQNFRNRVYVGEALSYLIRLASHMYPPFLLLGELLVSLQHHTPRVKRLDILLSSCPPHESFL